MLYSIHAKVEEELDHLVQEGINERISIVVIGYTKSEDYMVINTQRGIFRYNRLPFGICLLQGYSREAMENILHGIPTDSRCSIQNNGLL